MYGQFMRLLERQWKDSFYTFLIQDFGDLTYELQEPTFEDPDHISFESINLFKDLHEKF